MWFGILGSLLIRDGEAPTDIPKGRLRVLLAALLLRAGQVVPVDALAEAVWDGSPPPGAADTLRSHVMRLRRVLGPVAGSRVLTRYPGYLIEASEQEVDLLRFGSLIREGGAAGRAGQWGRAWELLTEGLGLWRGEPLADVPSDLLRAEQLPELERARLEALEWRADAGLHLGFHGELVAELQSLVAAHPLRERFHAELMLALVRCGRRAEALQAYQHAREVLVEELDTEPGPGLRELHQQILIGDPALAAPEHAVAKGRAAAVVPRELPAPVPGFVGRGEELTALTGVLGGAAASMPTAVVISAIGGTAGVGKTALAVQWAHQVVDRFPDGQLYVNLRGYDPDRPALAADALAGFLRALGVPGQDVPAEADERAARYRSLLAGRRVLVVLDNAGSVEQVRPLLPGSPGCVVVVTSRDSLAGLVARHGAIRMELDLLPQDEAVGLLRALIGQRVENDPGAAAALAAQCCRLPLALRVAAELAAARPDVPLAGLVGELADQQRRLDLLDAGGDPQTAVRAVLSWSYRHLDEETARAFRLVGLHPGADFDLYAAAALTGTTLGQAGTVLGTLARAHLIQPASPGRYGMHDLLRAYARELADDTDDDEERDAALTRLFDHYLHTAATAMDTLYPAERDRRPRVPVPDTPAPSVADPAAARVWLDVERAAMVAVTVHAARYGRPGHATQLSATLFRYLHAGGHYAEAVTIHSHARAAAQHAGDRAAEATALNYLGTVHRVQGSYQQAADHVRQALALFRQVGDRVAQARALNNRGAICDHQGRYREALSHYQEALAIYREIGDPFGKANTLNNLGASEERQGRYDLAASYYRQALAMAADIGARDLECGALDGLGSVGLRQGLYTDADGHLQRALALSREIGYREAEAEALARMGDLCLRQGHPEEAVRHLEESLSVCREIGKRYGEADALNSLGEVLLAAGQPDRARAEYAAALALAGDKYQQARAHHGAGQACHVDGDPEGARRHWRQALALFTELGTPEADQLRAQLAAALVGSQYPGSGHTVS